MKNQKINLYLTAILVLCGGLASCSKEEAAVAPRDAFVYITEANEKPGAKRAIELSSSAQTILFNVAYSGIALPMADIQVKLKASPELVATYNTKNKTSYLTLPATSYQFNNTSVIKAGEGLSIPLKLTVTAFPSLELGKEYLLPISIEEATGVNVNPGLKTAYFVIKPALADFNRDSWTVVSVSSEEASGEGPDNGRLIFVLDGNVNSFWHSEWENASPPPPYDFVIDMNDTKNLSGLTFVQRQGRTNVGGDAKDIKIEVSIDGSTWTNAGNYTLLSNNDKQLVFFAQPVLARYFKVTINTTYKDQGFSHLAEVGAF